MSEKVTKKGFGYVDDNDESLRSKAGGSFGLNTGAFVTKFEYNANAGADDALADAVDITLQVGDREYKSRIYDATTVYGKDSQKLTEGDDGYVEKYNTEMKQRQAVIIHVAKALGITDDILKKAFSTSVSNFADWAKVVCALPSEEAYKRPVDIFLEYQWDISDGETRKYLQLPKNMKGGRFICQSLTPVGGEWTAQNVKSGLIYTDSKNTEHPFERSADYMESKKANQEGEGATDNSSENMQASPGGKKSKW